MSGLQPIRTGVFVEAAVFELSSPPGDLTVPKLLARLERDPMARLIGTPHVLAGAEPTTLTLETRTGPLRETVVHQLSVVAQPSDSDRIVLELDLVLQIPTGAGMGEAGGAPPEGRIRLVGAPRERQVIASAAPIRERRGHWVLALITPYTVRREADLRSIFECKMWQREHARRAFE